MPDNGFIELDLLEAALNSDEDEAIELLKKLTKKERQYLEEAMDLIARLAGQVPPEVL